MTRDFVLGEVVVSKSGRDEGRKFIVVKKDGKFVYIADGDLRKIEKPKKKNCLHLLKTGLVDDELATMLEDGQIIRNADIRKKLAEITVSSGK